MIAVIDYSNAPDPLSAMKAAALERRARLYAPPRPQPKIRHEEPKPSVVATVVEPEVEADPAEPQRWAPSGPRHGKTWEPAEVICLREMAAEGRTALQIARYMRRTRDAVITRAQELKIAISLRGQKEVEDIDPADRNLRGRVRVLVGIVAHSYGLTADDLLGVSRNVDVIEARHHAMWLCARDTKLTYPQLGRAFRKDHTTVLHAVRRVNAIKGENVRSAGTPR